jgi:hypothetical protein
MLNKKPLENVGRGYCPWPRAKRGAPARASFVPSPWRARTYEIEQENFFNHVFNGHLDRKRFLAKIRATVVRDNCKRYRKKTRLVGGGFAPVSTLQSAESALQAAQAEAGRVLLDASERMDRKGFAGKLKLSWDDTLLVSWAETAASVCRSMRMDEWSEFEMMDRAANARKLEWMLEGYGFKWALKEDMFGSLMPTFKRFYDAKFWRRLVRREQVRVIDQIAREARLVMAGRQTYCSGEAVDIRRSQNRRNRGILERLEATNQDGDSYSLADLSDLSPSNPFVRRAELMVRIRGFEELADFLGHRGWFITLTCPSRFHPSVQVRGSDGSVARVAINKNYDGSTPRQAQEWLCKTWSLIRAQLAREGIGLYGFRVAEPHADGCPHWHFLLFGHPDIQARVQEVFWEKSLREDSEELGAKKYRIKFVLIDASKGSASGYIAKYISKNIDGSHIESDLLGRPGWDSARAIAAWSASHGIRQFQQIGGAPVTVWRELRRVEEEGDGLDKYRIPAQASDWCAFCLAMGGAVIKRDDLPVRAAYWHEFDQDTGEVIDKMYTSYGEVSKGKLFGILLVESGKYVVSRVYRWIVREAQRIKTEVVQVVKRVGVREPGSDEELDFMRSLSGGLSLDDIPTWGD